jgi:uncharacterized membrane protein YqhA
LLKQPGANILRTGSQMIDKILTSSRYITLIAVLGSFLAALASMIAGGVKSVGVVVSILQFSAESPSAKEISLAFIEVVDLFLIGTVFYIIALGLYELFIDDRLDLPAWLVIRNLDDLKGKLISGIVVIMGVYFLGVLIDGDVQVDLLRLSAAIALMIAALTFFQYINAKQSNH